MIDWTAKVYIDLIKSATMAIPRAAAAPQAKPSEGHLHQTLVEGGFHHRGQGPHILTGERGNIYQHHENRNHFIHTTEAGKWSSFHTTGTTTRLKHEGHGSLALQAHLSGATHDYTPEHPKKSLQMVLEKGQMSDKWDKRRVHGEALRAHGWRAGEVGNFKTTYSHADHPGHEIHSHSTGDWQHGEHRGGDARTLADHLTAFHGVKKARRTTAAGMLRFRDVQPLPTSPHKFLLHTDGQCRTCGKPQAHELHKGDGPTEGRDNMRGQGPKQAKSLLSENGGSMRLIIRKSKGMDAMRATAKNSGWIPKRVVAGGMSYGHADHAEHELHIHAAGTWGHHEKPYTPAGGKKGATAAPPLASGEGHTTLSAHLKEFHGVKKSEQSITAPWGTMPRLGMIEKGTMPPGQCGHPGCSFSSAKGPQMVAHMSAAHGTTYDPTKHGVGSPDKIDIKKDEDGDVEKADPSAQGIAAAKGDARGRVTYHHPEGHSLSVERDNDGSAYWVHTHKNGSMQNGGGSGTLHQHLTTVHGHQPPSGRLQNDEMQAAHALPSRFGYTKKG